MNPSCRQLGPCCFRHEIAEIKAEGNSNYCPLTRLSVRRRTAKHACLRLSANVPINGPQRRPALRLDAASFERLRPRADATSERRRVAEPSAPRWPGAEVHGSSAAPLRGRGANFSNRTLLGRTSWPSDVSSGGITSHSIFAPIRFGLRPYADGGPRENQEARKHAAATSGKLRLSTCEPCRDIAHEIDQRLGIDRLDKVPLATGFA
jgi:hypothetical protein